MISDYNNLFKCLFFQYNCDYIIAHTICALKLSQIYLYFEHINNNFRESDLKLKENKKCDAYTFLS